MLLPGSLIKSFWITEGNKQVKQFLLHLIHDGCLHYCHQLYVIVYQQELPGQVEGIIYQLSSVDHWNKLEKQD